MRASRDEDTRGHCPPLSCFEASDTSSPGCQLLLAFVCPQSHTCPLIPCLCVCLYSPSGLCWHGGVATSEVQRCHDLGRGRHQGPSSGWSGDVLQRTGWPHAQRLPSRVSGARVKALLRRRQGRSCPDLTCRPYPPPPPPPPPAPVFSAHRTFSPLPLTSVLQTLRGSFSEPSPAPSLSR